MRPGDKHGKLTAVQFLKMVWRGDKNVHLWRFRCNCGTELDRVSEYVIASGRRGNSPCCRKCHRKLYPSPTRLNLAGKKFGKLTALEPTGQISSNWRVIWRFRCECGEIVEKPTSLIFQTLRKGLSPNCGKPSCNNHARLEPGEAVKRRVIEGYRKGAKDRGLVFNLTKEQVERLLSGQCHYCGTEPLNIQRRKDLWGEFVYNGIDRIDNTKGYTLDNVVSCCKYCNRAKADMPYAEFMLWIKRLVEFQSPKLFQEER